MDDVGGVSLAGILHSAPQCWWYTKHWRWRKRK